MKRYIVRHLLANRGYLLALVHLVAFTFIYGLAFALRFDFAVPPDQEQLFWFSLLWVLGLKLNIFYLSGSLSGWWRYVTFSDLVALLRASTLSVLAIAAVDHFLKASYHVPLSILLLDWSMSILLIGGLRSAWRFSREQFLPMLRWNGHRRALIVGADHTGLALANQIQAHPALNYRVVGFLDPDPSKDGSRLGGIPVFGRLGDAPQVAGYSGAKDLLVTAGSLPGKVLRNLVEKCAEANVAVKVIPAVDDLLKGLNRFHLRDVDINDLLRREPIELDRSALATLLKGRTVLVTGAGGSIGREICCQVLRFNPQALVLVERAENNLFLIDREIKAAAGQAELYPFIADLLDKRRMRQIFQLTQPQVVFHAAAHKHVPLMESNPGEAIKNNVFGTKRLADIAVQSGVHSFVLISTDKAVNPSSIMGVSKQIAERYIHAFSQELSTTKFVVVRFGNVLGSAGSVVPLFEEQIRRGGPITVTHPDMRRFFMTIPEAAQLVLQAAAMGRGGEIFVLDMGEPVKIVDLARDLIHLSGLSHDDIEIKFTGTRPGEKLYEELYLEDEQSLPTPHPKLRVAYHRPYSLAEVRTTIKELWRLVNEPGEVIRRKLAEIVPEYTSPVAANGEAHRANGTNGTNGTHREPTILAKRL